MKLKKFLQLVGFLYAAKALFGVFYLGLGWQVAISGWVIPSWLVVVAIVVDAYLVYMAFKLAK